MICCAGPVRHVGSARSIIDRQCIEVPVDRDRSELSRDGRDGTGNSKVALSFDKVIAGRGGALFGVKRHDSHGTHALSNPKIPTDPTSAMSGLSRIKSFHSPVRLQSGTATKQTKAIEVIPGTRSVLVGIILQALMLSLAFECFVRCSLQARHDKL